jgi:hypothetical protein
MVRAMCYHVGGGIRQDAEKQMTGGSKGEARRRCLLFRTAAVSTYWRLYAAGALVRPIGVESHLPAASWCLPHPQATLRVTGNKTTATATTTNNDTRTTTDDDDNYDPRDHCASNIHHPTTILLELFRPYGRRPPSDPVAIEERCLLVA